MINDSDKDLAASQRVINYLNAGYQGAFAALNMLSRLESPAFREGDLTKIRQALEKVTAWVNELWQGNCLFCEAWTKPETFASQKALSVLYDLRPDLQRTRDQVVAILRDPHWPNNAESTKFLIAAFGRYVYSRDNYIRGFVEFGKVFKHAGIVDSYSSLLQGAGEEVKVAHQFLNTFKASNQQPQQFYDGLYYHSIRLPAIFATHIHDVSILIGKYGEPLTFASLGIDDPTAGAWQSVGIGAEAAGYWRAYDFLPEQAAGWGQAGLFDAATAYEWQLFGFDSQGAAPWLSRAFPPQVAASWANAGFEPDKALEMIEKGYTEPNMVPN